MNDEAHLDRYLSGEASLEELPEHLRAEESTLRGLLETVRDREPAPPTLLESVMREISDPADQPGKRAVADSPWARAFEWLVRPRSVRVSPAAAGLALAAATAIVMFVLPSRPSADRTQVPPVVESPGVVTRFVLIAPEAASVSLTGDFVDWDPEGIPLAEERASGVWTLDVPLEPGIYEYLFVIDGEEWRPDPMATGRVDDGFGRENSVVIVAQDRT